MTPHEYWTGWALMGALYLLTKGVDWYLLWRRR
jgi:hypothetical protein